MLYNTEIEQEVSNTVHQLPDLLTGTPETTEVDDTETTTVLESDSISRLETNECLHAIMPTISLPHMDDDTLQVETAATGTETCSQPSECSAMPFNPCTLNLQIGPTIMLPSDAIALEFFHLVFGEDTCNLIASETNEYARQNPPGDGYNRGQRNDRIRSWRESHSDPCQSLPFDDLSLYHTYFILMYHLSK